MTVDKQIDTGNESFDYTQSPHNTPHNYPPEYMIAILDISSEYRDRVELALDTDTLENKDTQQELLHLTDKINQILALFSAEDDEKKRRTPIGIEIGGTRVTITNLGGEAHMQKYRCQIGNAECQISASMRKTLLYIIAHSESGVYIASTSPHYTNVAKLRDSGYPLSIYFQVTDKTNIRFRPTPEAELIKRNYIAQRDTISIVRSSREGYYKCRDTKTGLETEEFAATGSIDVIINTYIKSDTALPLNSQTTQALAQLGLIAQRGKDGIVRIHIKS